MPITLAETATAKADKGANNANEVQTSSAVAVDLSEAYNHLYRVIPGMGLANDIMHMVMFIGFNHFTPSRLRIWKSSDLGPYNTINSKKTFDLLLMCCV